MSSDNPQERFVFSEIKPITDGPVRKPISPPVVTIAYPSMVLTPGMLADARNNTGTVQQQPNPTKMYPIMATITAGDVTTIKNPDAASNPPVTTTVLLPTLAISISPFNRPKVIATEKPA